MIEELKTLHPINFLGICLILSATVIACAMIVSISIVTAGMLGCAGVVVFGSMLLKPPEEKPRVITSVSNRPKLGSVATKAYKKARSL